MRAVTRWGRVVCLNVCVCVCVPVLLSDFIQQIVLPAVGPHLAAGGTTALMRCVAKSPPHGAD